MFCNSFTKSAGANAPVSIAELNVQTSIRKAAGAAIVQGTKGLPQHRTKGTGSTVHPCYTDVRG